MSAAEIGYRVTTGFRTELEYRISRPWRTGNRLNQQQGFRWQPRIEAVNSTGHLSAADRICLGQLSILGLRTVAVDPIPNWNRDPKTGIEIPLVFGKKLDFRDHTLVGDIKYVWEINRHQHLVTLAQAYLLSRDSKYLATIRVHLDSWLEQCPYAKGVNWSSSLELGLRIISWSFVWSYLEITGDVGSVLGKNLYDRWLQSIYDHLRFIRGYLSLYSSANNHLVGELAGLTIGALVWPYWKDTQRWLHHGMALLSQELFKQTNPDGGSREQTTWYQHFVIDLFVLAGIACEMSGHRCSKDYWNRLSKMAWFLKSLMNVKGQIPMIGDADGGVAARVLLATETESIHSTIKTIAALTGDAALNHKMTNALDKSVWLVKEIPIECCRIDRSSSNSNAFPDTGYYVLGRDHDTRNEIKIIMDVGALGYERIAAHGHADALSLQLSVAGREILVDPGTYSYHSSQKLRDYFKGTAAHNTVRVDGLDQSVSSGPFLWTHHARAVCEYWNTDDREDELRAMHDGYLRLTNPVFHKRQVRFLKQHREIFVNDILEGEGEHLVEQYWHFSEDCIVTQHQENFHIRHGSVSVQMNIEGADVQIELCRGDHNRPAGWISRRYDQLAPTTTMIISTQFRRPVSIKTHFKVAIGDT